MIGTQERFSIPEVQMSRSAYREMVLSIGALPPEAGGILLGPIGTTDITDFYFDQGGTCSGVTYSPDYITLRQKMSQEWVPSGKDMKGFAHSHPGRVYSLSQGDLNYIKRLLEKNEDMELFFAPIIIPGEFLVRPIVVLRNDPDFPRDAKLVLF